MFYIRVSQKNRRFWRLAPHNCSTKKQRVMNNELDTKPHHMITLQNTQSHSWISTSNLNSRIQVTFPSYPFYDEEDSVSGGFGCERIQADRRRVRMPMSVLRLPRRKSRTVRIRNVRKRMTRTNSTPAFGF